MKNKKVLTSIFIIFYVIVIILSGIFVIKPGINKLSYSSNMKEYSLEEVTRLTDEINNKYIVLEKDVNEKYEGSISEINSKYDLEVNELEIEYDLKEEEISNNYSSLKKKLKEEMNSILAKQNNEFFANGLSKRYYELQTEYSLKNDEYSDYTVKESKEKFENENKKNKEVREIDKKRNELLSSIDGNKKSELNRLKSNKEEEISNITNVKEKKNRIKLEAIIYITLGIILILLPSIYIVITYNKLTHLYNSVKEKWSQVDIYLKQRVDLIPNIVESIKGSTSFEKDTLTSITNARNNAYKASNKEDEIIANEELSNNIKKLLVLHEDYPELKSNENFMNLQNNLREIEDDIASSRSEYNKSVLNYKNKLDIFPSNIVGVLFKFKNELFFEIKEDEKENKSIKF